MNTFSNMQKKPGSPAASHMLWFFLLPAIAFMVWAGWKLVGNIDKKPETQESSLVRSLEKVEVARSAGDRWHAAYNFAHNLQRQQISGDFAKLAEAERLTLFTKMSQLLEKFPEDARLQRYLLLTLGQLSHPSALGIFEKFLASTDNELRFYAAWGLLETLLKNPETPRDAYMKYVLEWLKSDDASMKKIASAFLVQQKNEKWTQAVRALLKDPDQETRWNTAVVLASVGDASGRDILRSIFELANLRTIKYRSAKDLEQLVAAATDAARKLGDKSVLSQMEVLKTQVQGNNPEGRAILAGLR
jgi:hypothetical protein